MNALGYFFPTDTDSGDSHLPANIQRIALTAWAEAQNNPLDFAELTAWLQEKGFEVEHDLDAARMAGEKTGREREEVVRRADLVIVFGGDGSMLRTAHHVKGESPLLLGINTGHLGFLADVPQADLYPALERILLHEEFSIESRMRLSASVRKNDAPLKLSDSLNDVVLTTGPLARMVEYQIQMEGRHLGYFRADGLIVATPTGSTAYSLSAGGPLVLPELNVMLINPICPHTLSNRPIVVPAEAKLEITIFPYTRDQGREVLLTLDGFAGGALEAGDSVRIRKSRFAVRIIRPMGVDFFQTLREKLLWETHPRGGRKNRKTSA